jgi:HK97 family phage major capsid protein
MNIREELDKRNALMGVAEKMLNEGLETTEKRAAYDAEIEKINELDEVLTRAQGFDGLKGKKFTPVSDDSSLGFGKKELEQYSIVRGIRALNEARTGRADAWETFAPFELEASRAMSKKLGKDPQGFWVPQDVMKEKRDLTVGTPADGGYFKATELQSMIEMLRNRMILGAAGATAITGLVGDVAFPKQTAGGTAYWVAENNAPTESQQTIGQVLMQPKTLGAYTEYSRKLLLQSSVDVENFVRSDLSAIIARAVDLAGLHGTGASNQPTGVAATSGIGSVAGGTNGLAPTWVHITQLEREVAIDNADDGKLAYITNPKVRYKLKNTYRNATYGEIPIWADTKEQPLNGYPAKVTNQVSSALTKGSSSGVCSAIFFGNWAELLLGFWSGIDILLDPYSLSTTGGTRIVALQDVDVAVRHAESFAAMLDALTT